ncbi:MAG: hypothetical protein U0822_06005 [Anaerolineae bacterium]
MTQQYPKHIKKLLRQYADVAYERELRAELGKLAESFAAWQSGKISSWDLSDRIHEYYVGPSRDLYGRYNRGSDDINVAYAVQQGLISRDELPPELLEALAPVIAFYESH